MTVEDPENMLQRLADLAFDNGNETIQALLFTEAYLKLTETI